jgi:acyl-CoA synthetase (NDP forming)/GNAT superfamily N-acetyltransferase
MASDVVAVPRRVFVPPPAQDAMESGRVILRDGSTADIHVTRPEDCDAVAALFHRLTPESHRLRFFALGDPPHSLVERLCDSSDPREVFALVVTRMVGAERQVIATGSYVAIDATTAEVAFAVDDAFQHNSLGTQLLERLAWVAIRHGFRRFKAIVLPENTAMRDVFRDSGLEVASTWHAGELDIDLSLVPNQTSVRLAEERDRLNTEASLRPFFEPESVALIGASRDPDSIGHRLLESFLSAGFTGRLYVVHPSAESIANRSTVRSVMAITEPVDLAIIAVPRGRLLAVVDECGVAGVRALVVVTAGLAETGPEGRAVQDALVAKVRNYGMRLIGPNCMGLLNTDPTVRLNASFSPVFPPPGPAAFSSQSGAVGIAMLKLAAERGLGISTFVSTGNKADVSGNDLLQYWEGDPATRVILLYLESFGNPRRFARIARRVSRSKPIIAVKAGRTQAGRRASASHTAALAASDAATDALFGQTGVIRAETLGEMFDLASFLGTQPLPGGRRVGIITNAGGPGILCADACEAAGLVVAPLRETVRQSLASFLSSMASTANPVDMVASAGGEEFARAIAVLLADDDIDSLIVIHTPVGLTDAAQIADAVRAGIAAAHAQGARQKPVIACMLAEDRPSMAITNGALSIPVVAFPESAARVLGRVAEYVEWCGRPLGLLPDFEDIDPVCARDVCRQAVQAQGGGWLSASDTYRVLSAFGLPLATGALARSADEAAHAARRLGFPVALKLASRQIVHKTEHGGVHLNLTTEAAVREAFGAIEASVRAAGPSDAMDGVVVQRMYGGGVEVMIGVAEDPLFGPLAAFGLGGVHVELLRDVRFSITPLSDRDAADMVRGIRGFPLLAGYRGAPAVDIGALETVLLRVSRLVEEVPEIVELDLNPIIALPGSQGCHIVDARIRVAQPTPNQPVRFPIPSLRQSTLHEGLPG